MTLELPNSTGRTFRLAANEARIDLAENFAGESEPSPALEGMLWLDTLNNELKYCFQAVQSTTRWISILRINGNNVNFELPLVGDPYPAQALPSEISSGTLNSVRSYSTKDIKDAVVTHSPIFQDGASGIYIQRFTPRNPVSGRFWFNDQANTLAIYNGSRWVTLGSFGGEEPAFSLRGPTSQLETGNLSMLTTGSDSVERLWSAKVLKDGIDAISPKAPALTTATTLASGVGRSAVSISPYIFRQAVIRVAQSSTAGLSLSIDDFVNQGTIPKLVTGSTMNSILRHSSTGLTLFRMRDRSSTILGLVSGSLLSSYKAGLSVTSTVQDRIVYSSTSVRCSSSANRIYFNVSGRQVAYISSTGFWVNGTRQSSSTSGGGSSSVSSSFSVSAALYQSSSSRPSSNTGVTTGRIFYNPSNSINIARAVKKGGGYVYYFTRTVRINSSSHWVVDFAYVPIVYRENLETRGGSTNRGTYWWSYYGFLSGSVGGYGENLATRARTGSTRRGMVWTGTAYGMFFGVNTLSSYGRPFPPFVLLTKN